MFAMQQTILFNINVEISIAAERVHRAVDHRSGETTVFGYNPSDADIVRLTIIAVELDPLDRKASIVGLERRSAVGNDDAVGPQTALDLFVPQFEELDRSRGRGTDRPFMGLLVAPPAAADDHFSQIAAYRSGAVPTRVERTGAGLGRGIGDAAVPCLPPAGVEIIAEFLQHGAERTAVQESLNCVIQMTDAPVDSGTSYCLDRQLGGEFVVIMDHLR